MARPSIKTKRDLAPNQALVLSGIADLIVKVTKLEVIHDSRFSFTTRARQDGQGHGILAAAAHLSEEDVIRIRFELLRCGQDIRMPAANIFGHLARLGPKTHVVDPGAHDSAGSGSLWVEISVQAAPLSLARRNALVQEIKRIDDLAKELQEELPDAGGKEDQAARYKEVAELLAPVPGWPAPAGSPESTFWDELSELLLSAAPIVITADDTIALEWAAARLSSCLMTREVSLGKMLLPAISTRGVFEVAKRAPGIPVIPLAALRLAMPAEAIQNELPDLVNMLFAQRRSVVFTGLSGRYEATLDERRDQPGGAILSFFHLPAVDFEEMTRFAVHSAGQKAGGLPQQKLDSLSQHILKCIDLINPSDRGTILPYLVESEVRTWLEGSEPDLARTCQLINRLRQIRETAP